MVESDCCRCSLLHKSSYLPLLVACRRSHRRRWIGAAACWSGAIRCRWVGDDRSSSRRDSPSLGWGRSFLIAVRFIVARLWTTAPRHGIVCCWSGAAWFAVGGIQGLRDSGIRLLKSTILKRKETILVSNTYEQSIALVMCAALDARGLRVRFSMPHYFSDH
jgi:hypothetical protein